MPWVKIDDGFYDNQANRRLGPAARDLFLAGLCYCAKGLTDGRIDLADVPVLLASAQAKRAQIQRLLDAGRWVDKGDYYEVAEYLTYQPSKARVLADREASRARQARARARGSFGNGASHGVTDGVSHSLPDPTRTPLVNTSLRVTSSRGATARPSASATAHPSAASAVPQGQGGVVGEGPSVDFAHHPRPRLDDDTRVANLAMVAQLKGPTARGSADGATARGSADGL